MSAAVANPTDTILKLLGTMSVQEALACMQKAQAKVNEKVGIEAEKVKGIFHKRVVEIVGAERLAKLPVVTVEQLGFNSGFRWVADEDFPSVDPKKMPAPAVRGVGNDGLPFIAVRYSSNKDPSTVKVEYLYQRSRDSDRAWIHWGQNLLSCGDNMRDCDFVRLRDLLDGKAIKGDDRDLLCKSDQDFKMA